MKPAITTLLLLFVVIFVAAGVSHLIYEFFGISRVASAIYGTAITGVGLALTLQIRH